MPRRRTIIVPPKEEPLPGYAALGQRNKDQGLGGFPGPVSLAKRFLQWYSPKLYRRLTNMAVRERAASKEMRWLGESLKDMVIGRNSDFHTEELSDEQLEELGGIE